MAKVKKNRENIIKSNLRDSLPIIADILVKEVSEVMKKAKTEEDLRIGFEKILEPTLKELGIEISSRYERASTEGKTLYKGRPDAVHGQVIIEYESPRSFSSNRNIEHAYNQLVRYLSGESQSSRITQLVGVGFDGESIFFVQYRGEEKKAIDKTKFIRQGPYSFDPESARTLLIHLRALARLPLTAENLAEKFGSQSKLAPRIVSAFTRALEHWGNEKVQVFFNEWKRLFGIVYGERFTAQLKKEVIALSTLYKVGKETDFQELLFSIHTYFALLMKLIAMELLTLKETAFGSSVSHQLTHASKVRLKEQLTDIEEGGVYARRGITNFLEGDFFRWYLDAWSPNLEDAIREITRELSKFEPATTTIDPDSTRDLLKKLYQYLVPQEVRHCLGEYYTPDWLAELVLNEVGYNGNTLKKLLDPACGSGTFLVLAIQRAKKHGEKEGWPPLEIAKRITHNIWGFDLNPLAVIAARTNYLFALGDLVDQLRHLEIPIYLTDSVLWPERSGQRELNFYGGDYMEIKTSVKDFHVPYIWVRDEGFLMKEAAPLVEKFVKNDFEVDIAMKHFKENGLVFPPFEKIVENFYKEILELEKQNKNGIWARFLKNAFAPMIAGKFDFVVGNPPWIRWEYLSREYREATTPLLKRYGLYQTKDFASRSLGVGVKDFSMLFTYASADYYLRDGAKLGFLITQEVFKSKGAGEGFRQFQYGEKEKLKVLKAHDLVTVLPFEGAANKTAAIFLKKGEATTYPVPYILWLRKKGVGKIPTDLVLEEAVSLMQKQKLLAQPIDLSTGSWMTITENQRELIRIKGTNIYRARRGVETDPYGVYLMGVIQVLSDGDLLVRNLPNLGKKKIQQIEERVEQELIYPTVRGSDIERWKIKPEIFVIFPMNALKKEPYSELEMKQRWPRTYGYLRRFRPDLEARGSRAAKMLAQRTAFYAMLGYGPYTVARYKVIWKRMTNDIIAAVISQHKTPYGYKTTIPLGTTSFFSSDNESEAHYLCVIINSNPVRDFIKSFSSAGRGFGTPSVMKHVGIPKFDRKNRLHQKLTKISKKCHQLKSENKEREIKGLEKENDKLVKQLFEV